jgi:hypothetical protein
VVVAREDFLFNQVDWFSVERNQQNQLSTEISNMDSDRFLNTSTDDLCNYFEQKFRIDVPSLRENEIVADQNEVDIDVSHDHNLFIIDRSNPHYIKGTEIEITIPFDGDAEAFTIQLSTNTSNPPRAEVRGQVLILRIQGRDLAPESVKNKIQSTKSSINSYLNNLRTNVSGWNSRINNLARQQIENRKKKLLGDRNLVGSLGFPLKERGNNSMTYTAPNVRRKITPTLPKASTKTFKPEPTLATDDYEHILSVIENMANVMERSPSAFKSMNEEALRSHFLVQLNGHYEGQATGETFNYEGKTDILIRSAGRNLFIGECKYWGGPKKLTETIDQILGYSSWRDTKVAILIFNRRKDLSRVLTAIPETVTMHNNYKKSLPQVSETHFRYVFAHRDDANREMVLSILVFDVPE